MKMTAEAKLFLHDELKRIESEFLKKLDTDIQQPLEELKKTLNGDVPIRGNVEATIKTETKATLIRWIWILVLANVASVGTVWKVMNDGLTRAVESQRLTLEVERRVKASEIEEDIRNRLSTKSLVEMRDAIATDHARALIELTQLQKLLSKLDEATQSASSKLAVLQKSDPATIADILAALQKPDQNGNIVGDLLVRVKTLEEGEFVYLGPKKERLSRKLALDQLSLLPQVLRVHSIPTKNGPDEIIAHMGRVLASRIVATKYIVCGGDVFTGQGGISDLDFGQVSFGYNPFEVPAN